MSAGRPPRDIAALMLHVPNGPIQQHLADVLVGHIYYDGAGVGMFVPNQLSVGLHMFAKGAGPFIFDIEVVMLRVYQKRILQLRDRRLLRPTGSGRNGEYHGHPYTTHAISSPGMMAL